MIDKSNTHSPEMQQILKIVSVVLKIFDWIKDGKRDDRFARSFRGQLEQQRMKRIFNFLRQNLLCIEIKNASKQIVYFPFHPAFNYLSGSTKDNIMF